MYDYLVPNSPRKRIEHVCKTLRNVAYFTAEICAHVVGVDEDKLIFHAELPGQFPETKHPHEAMIPWVAVQLNAMQKDVDRGVMLIREYASARAALKDRLPQIAAWVAHARPDLSRLTIGEALRQMGDFEPETAPVPQGEVIYRFADDWTIQELTTEEQIFAEGLAVQNCMRESQFGADYADKVKRGTSRIFSLRLPSGKPCVSMEFVVDKESPCGGWFAQVLAKQNTALTAPADNVAPELWAKMQTYKPRIQEFVREAFAGEVRGMLASGADVRSLDLRGAYMRHMDGGFDLSGLDMTGANLGGANLTGANLGGANLTGANLGGANLLDADLTGATLIGATLFYASLTRANLTRANLAGANLTGAALIGANLTRANLTGADLTRANLTGADLTRANLSGAILSNANMPSADLSRADLSHADLSHTYLYNADLTRANLTGARYNAATTWPDDFAPPANASLVANSRRKSSKRKSSRRARKTSRR